MALRVWLPLNGNINNYGISDAVVTNSGAKVDNNGKIGKCYAFNGTNNYMTVPLKYSDTMTFALWYKPSINSNSFSSFHHIFDGRVNESGQEVLCLESPSFKAWGFHVSTNLPQNVWTHICAINNKGVVQIYVNGVLAGTGTTTMNSSYSGDLYIGARHSKQNFLAESMNDIRIYDHCLSPKEVKEISKGLCLHYKLDGVCNTIDSTEWDCSGFGNNGTKSGSITVSNNTGRYSSSYKFDTTSSKIKLPAFSYSGLANSYSFAWWQKNTSSGNMPWGFSDGNRLNLYHTTNLCWNTGDGGGNPFKDSSGTAIPNTRLCDSIWHHCVITGNGSTTKLYIDGIYAGAATTYKALTGTQIYISGWDTSTSYTFSGSNLSDFRIYATVLSDADIKELYNTSLSIDNVGNMYTYEFKEIE